MTALRAATYLTGIALMVSAIFVMTAARRAILHWDAAAFAAVERIGRIEDQVSRTLASYKAVPDKMTAKDGLLTEATKTVRTARHTADIVRDVAVAERNNAKAAGQASLATIQKTNALLDNSNGAVSDLRATLVSANSTVEALNLRIADPRIDMTFENLASGSRRFDSALGQADGILEDGHAISTHYRQQVTRPVGIFKSILNIVAPAAINGAVRR